MELFDKISPLWKQLFVIDIDITNSDLVNYDSYYKNVTMSTSGMLTNSNKIELKMQPDLNDQMIFKLIKNLLLIDHHNDGVKYHKSMSKELQTLLKSNGISLSKQNDPEYNGVIVYNDKGFACFLLRNAVG